MSSVKENRKRTRTTWSPSQEQELITMIIEGRTVQFIAPRLGKTISSIYSRKRNLSRDGKIPSNIRIKRAKGVNGNVSGKLSGSDNKNTDFGGHTFMSTFIPAALQKLDTFIAFLTRNNIDFSIKRNKDGKVKHFKVKV